ncbi:MAG: hypothetical protein KDE22_13120 [Rhodobacterales bacterium]|nr:hypothetical protein [Rhodobacterales bacterium]
MRKTLIKTALTTTLAIGALTMGTLAQPTTAQARDGWGAVRWDPAPRHQVRPDNRVHDSITVTLDRRVKNETLPLRHLLGLGADYNGYRIDRVIVTTQNRGKGRAILNLMSDRDVVDRARVGRDDRVVLSLPDGDKVLGRDLNTLRLAVDGNTRIRDITVHLSHRAARPHRVDGFTFYFPWSHDRGIDRTGNR